MTVVLEARGLSKVYRSRFPRRQSFTALAEATFDVRAGEVFAFLGPNGAGKTTAINLLLGFLRPSSGECTVLGRSPADRRSRERVGFLPETYAFDPSVTAPVLMHYFGRLHGISEPERSRRIDELIDRVGLSDARGRAIGKFSRGMRQRLGLAQALLNRPELLVLDEPTSGFDPVGRLMVRDLLTELKRAGTSIFLSSHILSEVESICDRVVILDRGRVVRRGTLDEVMGRGRGYEIVYREASETIASTLRELGNSPQMLDDGVRVVIKDEGEAQRALDTIREGGGVIVRYQVVGRSLEDAFIDGVAPASVVRSE